MADKVTRTSVGWSKSDASWRAGWRLHCWAEGSVAREGGGYETVTLGRQREDDELSATLDALAELAEEAAATPWDAPLPAQLRVWAHLDRTRTGPLGHWTAQGRLYATFEFVPVDRVPVALEAIANAAERAYGEYRAD